MKKILIGAFFLLATAMFVSAEESVTKVTYFPVSYAGYHQLNVTNLDVGVGQNGGNASLGKTTLEATPLVVGRTENGTFVPGLTNIEKDLTVNTPGTVWAESVKFGNYPRKNTDPSKLTFKESVRIGNKATLRNLAANTLNVNELYLYNKSANSEVRAARKFPTCYGNKDADGNNMYWAKLRICEEEGPGDTCKKFGKCAWHLACGTDALENECVDATGMTCTDWHAPEPKGRNKQCTNSVDSSNRGNIYLGDIASTGVADVVVENEEDFDAKCCGKTCERWGADPWATTPPLQCAPGTALAKGYSTRAQLVTREQFQEKCCVASNCHQLAKDVCGIADFDSNKEPANSAKTTFRMSCTQLNQAMQNSLPTEWQPHDVLFFETRGDWTDCSSGSPTGGPGGCVIPRPQRWHVEPIRYYWDIYEGYDGQCQIQCRLNDAKGGADRRLSNAYFANFKKIDGNRFPVFQGNYSNYPLRPINKSENKNFYINGNLVLGSSALQANSEGTQYLRTETYTGEPTIGQCYIAYHCPKGFHSPTNKNNPLGYDWSGQVDKIGINTAVRECVKDNGGHGYGNAWTGGDDCRKGGKCADLTYLRGAYNTCKPTPYPWEDIHWCSEGSTHDCFGDPYPWSEFVLHNTRDGRNKWTCWDASQPYAQQP